MQLEDFKQKNKTAVFYLEQTAGGAPLLKYPLLDAACFAEHGFTTRAGGVSGGCLSSLNLSYTRGDVKADVDENYRRLAVSLHAVTGDFVLTDQTHTTNVRVVTQADRGKGIVKEKDYRDVDGLVTNVPGIVLSAFFADCVPLFFIDVAHRAIGVSHSGWRGTLNRMGRETLAVMRREYGTDPADTLCAIGPSICQDCYEVSADVAERFLDEFPNAGRELCRAMGHGKYQLNLWKANERVLLEAGVLPEHLAVTNICTRCNEKLLFSHRASKGRRGNLGAFLKIRK